MYSVIWKSVNVWGSYGQELVSCLFLTHGVASHYEVGLGRAAETRDKFTLYVTGWTCLDQEVGSVSVLWTSL